MNLRSVSLIGKKSAFTTYSRVLGFSSEYSKLGSSANKWKLDLSRNGEYYLYRLKNEKDRVLIPVVLHKVFDLESICVVWKRLTNMMKGNHGLYL